MHESSSSVGNFAWPSITRNPENTPLLEVLDGVVLRPIPLHEISRCFQRRRARFCWVSRPRWLCASPGGRGNIEFLPGGGRFSATHVPLGALIQTAYNLTSPQCQAKAEHPVSAAEMLRLLQSFIGGPFQAGPSPRDKRDPGFASRAAYINDAAPFHPYHARGVEDTPITRWISLFRTQPWPTLRGAFPR